MVVNSSASLVKKLFVHHLRGINGVSFLFIEHLNVLEEFLNITISGGVIFVRDSPTTEEERISLIKPNVDLNYLFTSMPNIFNSDGLSEERKLYSVIQTCMAVLQ